MVSIFNNTLLNYIPGCKHFFTRTQYTIELTKQKMDIGDGITKLSFHYEISGATDAAHSIYALTLYEQDAELVQKDGKPLFR